MQLTLQLTSFCRIFSRMNGMQVMLTPGPAVCFDSVGFDRSGVKEDWHGLAERLAATRPVLIFDNRGMGESDIPEGPYTMEQFARDTLGLAAHVGFKTFNLMGISMGGMISQHVAIAAPPGVVRRLILGCTHHGGASRELTTHVSIGVRVRARVRARAKAGSRDRTRVRASHLTLPPPLNACY